MRISRPLLAAAVLLTASTLVACGEDDEPANRPPASSSPESPDQPPASSAPPSDGQSTTSTDDPAGALPAACDVLTPEDVEAAFGVDFGEPGFGAGGHTEDNVEWQSDNCDWEATDLLEVTFALTGPDDFQGGTLQCPEPTGIASEVTPVDVVGAQSAWWDRDDSPPLEATLRVCTAAYNFDIDVEFEDGVDFQGDPQQQSITLAQTALSTLGG